MEVKKIRDEMWGENCIGRNKRGKNVRDENYGGQYSY